jgi:hypothetical protein
MDAWKSLALANYVTAAGPTVRNAGAVALVAPAAYEKADSNVVARLTQRTTKNGAIIG